MRPLARLTIMSKKLPASSQRRGRTSFQTSGRTFLRGGLGREEVRSAVVALPVPRMGRSADFIPVPKLDAPKEGDIVVEPVYAGGWGSTVSRPGAC